MKQVPKHVADYATGERRLDQKVEVPADGTDWSEVISGLFDLGLKVIVELLGGIF